ncbi:MAG: hypothetical protein KDC84_07715 [Crocinitomicaceae bacterium]|nr:hypothetical protein [Crocinitomicaceae bacterium]
MKRLIYTTIFFSIISIGYAQENVNVSKKNGVEVNQRLTEAERTELQSKKDLLKALDKKEAWIRSNPEELKLAEESGWFANAEKTRAEVRKRIKELENK